MFQVSQAKAVLPVPPLQTDDLRLPIDMRLRLAVANKVFKAVQRPWVMAGHSRLQEQKDLPFQDAVREAMGDSFDSTHPNLRGLADLPDIHFPRDRREFTLKDLKNLMKRAEEFLHSNALENECMPILWEFLSKAYEATAPDVLSMIRLVKNFSNRSGFTAVSRKDLDVMANELLHSLTNRLENLPLKLLYEVQATMRSCEIESEAFGNLLENTIRRTCSIDRPS